MAVEYVGYFKMIISYYRFTDGCLHVWLAAGKLMHAAISLIRIDSVRWFGPGTNGLGASILNNGLLGAPVRMKKYFVI